MCSAVVGRHCNADSILAIPIYNEKEVIKCLSCRELCDLREGKKVHANMGSGGLRNWEGLETATCLLSGLLDYLVYWTCLALCERIFLHIWPVEIASESMIGLRGASMVQGDEYLGQNLIFNCIVAFLCVGNAETDLMLVGIIDEKMWSAW